MEELPEAVVEFILSNMSNARDIAACNCVSKQWKGSTPFMRSLYFPRNSFDNNRLRKYDPDEVIRNMLGSIVGLEELVVYCPFTMAGLVSWLKIVESSLKHLELRLDNNAEQVGSDESPSKLHCIGMVRNLESLKLWGVLMTFKPRWDVFPKLKVLEIVGAKLEQDALHGAIQACPNLTSLVLLSCEGVASVTIQLPLLEHCKLDFCGSGKGLLSLTAPRIESLDVQGCSWISVPKTDRLRSLSISNNSGRVYMVDFGKLSALDFLSIRGVQWSWNAVSKMLEWSSEVKHLFMKVEFTGDYDALKPFPEIDLVEFFNSHPKLRRFDAHGAMFAALCQKNSLKNLDHCFTIPCLEEMVITVRSPLNAEQKMSTLESIVKYGKNLKKMVIKISQMKSNHSSADDFFDDICKFRFINRKIVQIE
ncbi:hypothetical protein MLD38_023183 [Melastoma candidum]|uniref:Uncharacterized protein n=1 Tax=Melastoma candidum TaxID=119954 RepID=A0ACB9QQM3_9MYRT|nr:hypothetical protein MLD38_023183 [Melastoma candidum]